MPGQSQALQRQVLEGNGLKGRAAVGQWSFRGLFSGDTVYKWGEGGLKRRGLAESSQR